MGRSRRGRSSRERSVVLTSSKLYAVESLRAALSQLDLFQFHCFDTLTVFSGGITGDEDIQFRKLDIRAKVMVQMPGDSYFSLTSVDVRATCDMRSDPDTGTWKQISFMLWVICDDTVLYRAALERIGYVAPVRQSTSVLVYKTPPEEKYV